jgi:hypothetical protein
MTQESRPISQEHLDSLSGKLQGLYEGLSTDEKWALTTIVEAATQAAESNDVAGYCTIGKRASDIGETPEPPIKLPSLPFSLFRFFK